MITPLTRARLETVLRAAGISANSIVSVDTGWDFCVWVINDQWICRVPRRREVAEFVDREQNLLNLVSSRVDFAVPVARWRGDIDGVPVVVYPRIDGHEFRRGDDISALVSGIRQLHDVPLHEAAAALGLSSDSSAWASAYEHLWTRIEGGVMPQLQASEQKRLADVHERFMRARSPNNMALVHRDLTPEHILFSEDGVSLNGIIDFGDATIGDPAIDFAGIVDEVGWDQTLEVSSACGEIDAERIRFYYVIAPAHGILHADSVGHDRRVHESRAELSRRLMPH